MQIIFCLSDKSVFFYCKKIIKKLTFKNKYFIVLVFENSIVVLLKISVKAIYVSVFIMK